MNSERQIPLDFHHAAGQSRDDLIVSPANATAVAAIERWPDWPSPVTVLAGPAGSGKSHLAAIWSAATGAGRVNRTDIGQVVERRSSGPFLVEDADRGGLDETGLFHLINDVLASGSTLLMTARGFPAAWGVKLPDLASRLKAASIVELQEPDDALLAGVIAKLFADRQIEVEPHVIQYVSRRIERSLATAIAVVERLDRASLESRSRVTRALAAQVVTAFDEGQGAFNI